MAEIKTEQEPSIEEILESIRQIISEDGTPVEAPAAPVKLKAPEPAPQPALRQPPAPKPVAPPPPVAAPAPPPAPERQPEPILDLTDKIETEFEPEAEQPQVNAPRIVLEEVMEDEEHLVSDLTADAAVASLARLLANNMALERELPGKPGPLTLEDMARELMRPLIKQWLDQNLQKIIEKMVAREIERLSLRAMDK